MALVKCNDCGSDVSTQATSCPKCGRPMNIPKLPNAKNGGCGQTIVTIFVGTIVVVWLMSKLQSQPTAQVSDLTAAQSVPVIAPSRVAPSAGDAISVPSDPGATYSLVSIDGRNPVIVVTKRIGKSGQSFSKREIHCNNQTWRYLGTGDNIDAMNASRAAPELSVALEGSIAWHVVQYACRGK